MSEERRTAADRLPARDERTGRSAAAARISNQTRWVDLQVQRAIERGEWDDLPGYGKPIEDLGKDNDPDWWVKKLVEREQITGVLPPALAIRKEDAELDDRLDRITTEKGVRQELEEFNVRVHKALYTPPTSPTAPAMVTRQRDVEAEVEAWLGRRTARQEAQRRALAEQQRQDAEERPRGWLRRRRRT
ncbi:DUF1992 domain-containing protein [uncultured Nocardioides sp.]|uniref:DnaJ family domain-containing protein n=1 Tax=uncultured Nocardioides sp. TaxID=198441 RepID=UPI0025F8C37A|nr:DUF1992 domain-containing protein [uncultured Nocardioides sp.]